jgi:hypothetical protein
LLEWDRPSGLSDPPETGLNEALYHPNGPRRQSIKRDARLVSKYRPQAGHVQRYPPLSFVP